MCARCKERGDRERELVLPPSASQRALDLLPTTQAHSTLKDTGFARVRAGCAFMGSLRRHQTLATKSPAGARFGGRESVKARRSPAPASHLFAAIHTPAYSSPDRHDAPEGAAHRGAGPVSARRGRGRFFCRARFFFSPFSLTVQFAAPNTTKCRSALKVGMAPRRAVVSRAAVAVEQASWPSAIAGLCRLRLPAACATSAERRCCACMRAPTREPSGSCHFTVC